MQYASGGLYVNTCALAVGSYNVPWGSYNVTCWGIKEVFFM